MENEQIKKWRLILGEDTEKSFCAMSPGLTKILGSDEAMLDEALESLYGTQTSTALEKGASKGKGHSLNVAKWLGNIRKFFDKELVAILQNDAIERKGLKQLLLEPEILESLQPDINIISTLVSLNNRIPEKTKQTARGLIKRFVDEIKKKLENNLRSTVVSAKKSNKHSPLPSATNLDFNYTIKRNLKNFNVEKNMIIPERFYFFDRVKNSNSWNIILDIDQSGSMASSVIYASIMSCILASIPAITNRIVCFDTEVVDYTDICKNDPVDFLFGVQLGGGTDINKSVAYCQQYVTNPSKTIFFLVTDLYEGGNQASLISRLQFLKESGVTVICLLALDDNGTPSYDTRLANELADFGVPSFACSPDKFPNLLGMLLSKKDITPFIKEFKNKNK